ncbi:MAG TPA: response regulator [Gemmatimonadales bacterium]|nr:response regulator [Gemmatimonadales bacterium]
MTDPATPSHALLLCATSYPAEALMLRAALEPAGWSVAAVDDAVTAMLELCRKPERFAAVLVGERVGRASGLSLCGLLRDSGCGLPIVLLTTQDSAAIAGRAARLRVSVLWEPVSSERLQRSLDGLMPRRLCTVS